MIRFCDETDVGFGWIHPEPKIMDRAAQAVLADGGVWLVDPIDGDGVDDRIRALGEVRGVVQGLDRHPRDNEAFAARYGVPLHVVPRDGVPGAPFEAVRVTDAPGWREVGLWFEGPAVLVVPEALGAGAWFRVGDEAVGVHPMRRLWAPYGLRRFVGVAEHLVFGHGEGVHGVDEVEHAILDALDGSRRRLPLLGLSLLKRLSRR